MNYSRFIEFCHPISEFKDQRSRIENLFFFGFFCWKIIFEKDAELMEYYDSFLIGIYVFCTWKNHIRKFNIVQEVLMWNLLSLSQVNFYSGILFCIYSRNVRISRSLFPCIQQPLNRYQYYCYYTSQRCYKWI